MSLPRKVLYCGEIAKKDCQRSYVSSAFLIDIWTFEVQQLGDMHRTRVGAGVVNCKSQVYVFGGDNENKQGAEFGNLRECEKLGLLRAFGGICRTWPALGALLLLSC